MEVENPVVDAVADLVVASENNAAETAIIIDNVIEAANERVEAAEQMAADIMAGAMETERGQRVAHVEERQWQGEMEVAELRREMTELKTTLAEVMTQLSSLTTLAVVAPTQAASSSLIPPPSENSIQEATAEVMEVLPGNLENVAEENPVPVPPAPVKRRRWI